MLRLTLLFIGAVAAGLLGLEGVANELSHRWIDRLADDENETSADETGTS